MRPPLTVVIGEAVQRAQIARQLQAEQQTRVLRDIGQALITAFDVTKLTDMLADRLPDLGIASCYFALYDDLSTSLARSRLVLAWDNHSSELVRRSHYALKCHQPRGRGRHS